MPYSAPWRGSFPLGLDRNKKFTEAMVTKRADAVSHTARPVKISGFRISISISLVTNRETSSCSRGEVITSQ